MPSTFQAAWLKDVRYQGWVAPVSENKLQAKCKICDKVLDISTMGASALNSHNKSDKHKKLYKNSTSNNLRDFLATTSFHGAASSVSHAPVSQNTAVSSDVDCSGAERSSVSCTTSNTNTPSGSLNTYLERRSKMNAELWWTLRTVEKNQSFSSNDDNNFVFKKMFVDSKIAEGYSCGETKSMYLCNYALQPYCEKLLLHKVNTANHYVILFDESLNQFLAKKQLDFHIRFWDTDHGMVITRFLTSHFLGRACAKNLVDSFCSLKVDLKGMVQVSMDGPNVNLATYRDLENHMDNAFDTGLLNLGSCGLHQVHNAFRAAFSSQESDSNWDVGKFLRALSVLFDNVPARCELYEDVTGSNILPLQFCTHRWVENVKPAERAIEMLPHLSKYVDTIEQKLNKEVKNPGTASYDCVRSFIKCPLAKAKVAFFVTVGKSTEQFLVKYQTDKPMAPFLGEDLEGLLMSFTKRFIKASVLHCKQVLQIDLANQDNHKSYKEIDVGFVATEVLKASKVSDRVKMQFRCTCQDIMTVFVQKLCEKCPLLYPIVRNLSCLNPHKIAREPQAVIGKFHRVLKCMTDARLVLLSDCDAITTEYADFVHSFRFDAASNSYTGLADTDSNRLDTLYYSSMKDSYPKLWQVVKILLLLSHGQATVERGFSVNKEVLEVNQSEESVLARRRVKDHIQSIGGLSSFVITDDLITLGLQARKRYGEHLEEKKRKSEKGRQAQKRKPIEQEIEVLSKKKKQLQVDRDRLLTESVKALDRAEAVGNLAKLAKGNALRRAADDKLKELKNVNALIVEKDELLKNTGV
jgi:hypothetical protein